MQGFDCAELLYSDYAQLPEDVEAKLGAKYSSLEDLVKCVLACVASTSSQLNCNKAYNPAAPPKGKGLPCQEGHLMVGL